MRPAPPRLMHPDVFGLPVSILYQDDALVAVDKPSGMLVHRTPGARDPVVVMTYVRDAVGTHAWPVHRLDRDTSGVVLVAITLRAAQRTYELFKRGAVRKTYVAVVAGVPPEEGVIDEPLEKRPGQVQSAVTELACVARGDGCGLLRVSPRTGRRHQIRRHLSSAGLPILGDRVYGDAARDARFGVTRLALHASRLELPHPLTGEPLCVESPLPGELADALARLGLGKGASGQT